MRLFREEKDYAKARRRETGYVGVCVCVFACADAEKQALDRYNTSYVPQRDKGLHAKRMKPLLLSCTLSAFRTRSYRMPSSPTRFTSFRSQLCKIVPANEVTFSVKRRRGLRRSPTVLISRNVTRECNECFLRLFALSRSDKADLVVI